MRVHAHVYVSRASVGVFSRHGGVPSIKFDLPTPLALNVCDCVCVLVFHHHQQQQQACPSESSL